MKKDVIYIDTEDDITAIIDKVKHAEAPIVALVPPKRVGVLQSTVNLRLLQRAADSANKRVVLITNDHALTALAAGLALPIAKNLQSKPEIASLDTPDGEENDIIDGANLPVGELAGLSLDTQPETATGDNLDESDTSVAATDKKGSASKDSKSKDKSTKIPNFDSFRKKLFIFGGLGVVAIAFLVWAIFFAGQATIAITARTNVVNISKTLQLKKDATLDTNQAILPVVAQQQKKTVSVDFTPTGKKDVGEKATGTVKFTTNSISALGTIAAGTTLSTTGGVQFTTDAAVTLTLANALSGVTTTVTAVTRGTASNAASGAISGAPSGVNAALTGPTAGGTDKTITIVTADDVAKATERLKSQDSNSVRTELAKLFDSDVIVITEAYTVDSGTPTSTPAVDQESSSAKLTVETTYTLLGVKRADLKAVYDSYLTTQLKGDTSQKVFKSGDESTQFSSFQKLADGSYTVRAIASAQVGPNIDSSQVASDSRGKMIGEVQQTVSSIQGVENVNVSLSPFWVTRVPSDTNRIKVTFTIQSN